MIERLQYDMPGVNEIKNKINELVDAVNEMKTLIPPSFHVYDGEKRISPKKENQPLLVPDEVEFTKGGSNYSMGLNFGKQNLYYLDKIWRVCEKDERVVKCQLIPCKLEDLQAGDWCFEYRPNCPRGEEIKDLENYHLNVGNNTHVYVNEGIQVCNLREGDYYKYYKVVPL